MSSRRRGDSIFSTSSDGSLKKGRCERLVDASRLGQTVGVSFVSDATAISERLVAEVSDKACQFNITFKQPDDTLVHYFGQGGLIRGDRIPGTPETKKAEKASHVMFESFARYETTPVTAKHNLESAKAEQYHSTSARFASDGNNEKQLDMPDGGCKLTNRVVVRGASENEAARTWEADDVSFGKLITNKESFLTISPLHFVKVPIGSFRLQIGHKIGIAVYRTFDITTADASAPASVDMAALFGMKHQACIYTGEVTELSSSGETFCHNINTFEGCSGAVVFLLDQNQTVPVHDEYHGMAVGIHVGGLDKRNNLGFLLKSCAVY